MAKIAQVSAKYIVHASIVIDGIVDRPDVIGAIFGQTEGLLGADLELRELQRSGRIGRIEVNINGKGGKAQGEIIVPSSLDKAETAIVGAALEIIQRIGPCNAKIHVTSIEDIRISKRQYVIDRAKELLKTMMEDTLPDSQELSDEVAYSVRVMEVEEWGADKLPAGPAIEESEDIILVEGRADVLNLLKHGFKNAISINGTSIPESIVGLCHEKTVTVFCDGDRGGDLIIKELMERGAELDFVTKAPDGKEVEELAKKEIHKALRSKITAEQFRLDFKMPMDDETRERREQRSNDRREEQRGRDERRSGRDERPRRDDRRGGRDDRREAPRREEREEPRARKPVSTEMSAEQKASLGKLLEDLLGTHGAYVLDSNLKILGKVPGTELVSTIQALKTGMHAVVYDGQVDRTLVSACEETGIPFIVGMSANYRSNNVQILTAEEML